MLVNRTEYATGLGDLASTLKARSKANKPTNAPGIAQTLAPGFSGTLKTQAAANKVIKLVGRQTALANWNANQNINIGPAPTAPTDAQVAAAKLAYAMQVQKTGTIDQKASPTVKALLSAARPGSFSMPSSAQIAAGIMPASKGLPSSAQIAAGIMPASKGLPSVANSIRSAIAAVAAPAAAAAASPPAISPATQQAAAALVAAQPSIVPSSDAGGGGGGGGGDTSTSPDGTTDMTMAPTGWAALSDGTKIAIVAGGLVVAGGIYYLIKRR